MSDQARHRATDVLEHESYEAGTDSNSATATSTTTAQTAEDNEKTPSLREAVIPERMTAATTEHRHDDKSQDLEKQPTLTAASSERHISPEPAITTPAAGKKDASGFDYPDGGVRAWL